MREQIIARALIDENDWFGPYELLFVNDTSKPMVRFMREVRNWSLSHYDRVVEICFVEDGRT